MIGDVHVTIPGWVIDGLLTFWAFGFLLAPLLIWVQARYIEPPHRGRDAFRGIRWRGLPVYAACWPGVVWVTARMIRRHGWR